MKRHRAYALSSDNKIWGIINEDTKKIQMYEGNGKFVNANPFERFVMEEHGKFVGEVSVSGLHIDSKLGLDEKMEIAFNCNCKSDFDYINNGILLTVKTDGKRNDVAAIVLTTIENGNLRMAQSKDLDIVKIEAFIRTWEHRKDFSYGQVVELAKRICE